MGQATLNVWVHDKADPCKISDDFWYVTVTYCDGKAVEWCNHTYSGESAKCGHAEFQLPPGCYVIQAFRWVPLPFPAIFFLTDHALVVAGCDETACVHLYVPTDRQHPGSASMSTRFLAETKELPRDRAEEFVEACDALLKDLPKTARDTAFEQLLEQLAETFKRNPPPESSSTK